MSDVEKEVKSETEASDVPAGKDGESCACPETKASLDECIMKNGEENCQDLIEAHKACMLALGFKL